MREGEKNGRAKLTPRRVEVLREYYQINRRPPGAPKHPSWVTPYEIAKKIKMSLSSVQSMLNRDTWK